jgi:hypothetical protein
VYATTEVTPRHTVGLIRLHMGVVETPVCNRGRPAAPEA